MRSRYFDAAFATARAAAALVITACAIPGSAADLQTHTVPWLGELERRQTVELDKQRTDLHGRRF